jgi:hypothetical protein
VPDQAQLKYQTSLTVNLDVLKVYGIAEPDHLEKSGLVHEMMNGTISEQIAGSRRCPKIDFQVMTALNRRKVVDWWLDPNRLIVCLATAPGKPTCTPTGAGTLNGDFKYKISTVDMIGESACGTASDAVTLGVQGCDLAWTNATSPFRYYKIYRSISPYSVWDLVDYSLVNSYSDPNNTYRAAVTPPAAATQIAVITTNTLEFQWGYETELARMLTLELREASIFLPSAGFPI